MSNFTEPITYRQLLDERKGKGFSEPEVIDFLQQVLPQLAARDRQGNLQGMLSLDTLARQHDHVIWLPDSTTPSQTSITRYIYDLGLCAIELLTAKPLNQLRNPDGFWTWENYCFVSEELAHTIERMLKDFPQHRFQSANEVLSALNNGTIPPSPPYSNPPSSSFNHATNGNSSPLKELDHRQLNLPQSDFTYPPVKAAQTPTHISSPPGLAIWQLGLIGLAAMVTVVGGGLAVWKLVEPEASIFALVSNFFIFEKELKAKKIGNKWGYVDPNGKFTINPKFDGAEAFSEGLAKVKIGNKWGYINRSGKLIINTKFDETERFDEGLAKVKVGDKWGLIDRTGQTILNPEFDEIGFFEEGMARVKIDDKWGYIDRTAKPIIHPQFDDAWRFYEGLAAVKINDKWGYIDKTGKIIITPQFDISLGFTEGLAEAKLGDKWGYIDKTGKIIINPQFDYSGGFYEGLAAVKIDDKWGYIDKTGKIIINPQFDDAKLFIGGVASVKIGNRSGSVDKTGKVTWQPSK
jgi:hypothetical protein